MGMTGLFEEPRQPGTLPGSMGRRMGFGQLP
jgi:hypothetical protein